MKGKRMNENNEQPRPVCTAYSGMSICQLSRGHVGAHHDNDTGKSW